SLVPPSGPRMKVWNAPPGRSSNARTSVVHGFGHHHSFSSCGSVQARQSLARGARTRREMTRSFESSLATVEILLVKPFGERRHTVAARLPDGTLRCDPALGARERLRSQLAGAHATGFRRADDAALL